MPGRETSLGKPNWKRLYHISQNVGSWGRPNFWTAGTGTVGFSGNFPLSTANPSKPHSGGLRNNPELVDKKTTGERRGKKEHYSDVQQQYIYNLVYSARQNIEKHFFSTSKYTYINILMHYCQADYLKSIKKYICRDLPTKEKCMDIQKYIES